MFLADACALIVLLADPRAQHMMTRSFAVMRDDTVAVLPITIWEITQKVAAGKLPPMRESGPSLAHLLRAQGYEMHPLTWEDAEAANKLPPHHQDPMDRLLIATALRADMTIITSDAVFGAYGVTTIW